MREIALIFFILVVPVWTSCYLVSLEDEGCCQIYPSEDNQILLPGETIRVSFPEDVNPYRAEQIIDLSAADDTIRCSFNWSSGSSVELIPLEVLCPGIRHCLEINGQYESSGGQSREADLLRVFYYRTDHYDPLRVLSFSPVAGDIITDTQSLIFRFNRPPDEASLMKNLTLSPDTSFDYVLEEEELVLSPREAWDNLTDYSFSLSKELTDGEGLSLDPAFETAFTVVAGISQPYILKSGAAEGDLLNGFPYRDEGSELPRYRDGFRISFSEDMDRDSVETAFSMDPYPGGDLYWNGERELIFQPLEGWLMDQIYELRISKAARSLNDISLQEDYSRSFRPDIPLMALSSLECLSGEGFSLTALSSLTAIDLPVSEGSPFYTLFRLTFTCPFTTDREKQKAQEMIRLYEIFSSDGSPRAASWSWSSDYSLSILYSGFYRESGREHYYMLEIRGGETGLRNDSGSFLPESLDQLFRCRL